MGEDLIEDPKHFDPLADREERRQLRHEYRELISHTQKNRVEFIRPQSTGLNEGLTRCEELYHRVKLTREASLDSRFVKLSSNLGTQQAKKFKPDLNSFDLDELAAKLVTFMGGRYISRQRPDDDENEASTQRPNYLDWDKLGKKVAQNFKKSPKLDFMVGALALVPPEQRVRQAIKKTDKPDLSQKLVPVEVDLEDIQKEARDVELERLFRCLKKATQSIDPKSGEYLVEPVCLFEFTVNPRSFGQTVENLFHLSFLLMDGRIQIELDEDSGLPFISPSRPYSEELGSVIVHRKIAIIPFTYQKYKELVEVFNITESIIPPRPPTQKDT